jgi:hypothetical protein
MTPGLDAFPFQFALGVGIPRHLEAVLEKLQNQFRAGRCDM